MKTRDKMDDGKAPEVNDGEASRRIFLKRSLTLASTLAAMGITGSMLEAVFSKNASAEEKSSKGSNMEAVIDVLKEAIDTGEMEKAIKNHDKGRLTKDQVKNLRELDKKDLAALKALQPEASAMGVNVGVGVF